MKRTNRLGWLILLAIIITASCFGLKAKAATVELDGHNVHDGTVGVPYSATIYIFSGNAGKVKSFNMVGGWLPEGLSASLDYNSNAIVISGTPTKAEYCGFVYEVETEKGLTASFPKFHIDIKSPSQTYKLTVKNCFAKHSDGSYGTTFKAGERVSLEPESLAVSQYIAYWTATGGVNITAGVPGESIYVSAGNNAFYMPASDVTVECAVRNKDLGTHEQDAIPNKGADHTCGATTIETIKLALSEGIIGYAGKIKEFVTQTDTQNGMGWDYDVDLDKDGTADMHVRETRNYRHHGYGFMLNYLEALDGRSVYGSWTVEIPSYVINSKSSTGLYSKLVLYMGSKDSSGSSGSSGSSSGHKHSIKAVLAKAPGCETDGWGWHCECTECGEWFWDINGNTKITNKDSVIKKATGHNWSKWTVLKAPTETEDGIRERYCYNNKSHVEQSAIPATGVKPTEAPPETTAEPTTEVPTTEAPPETTAEPTTEVPTTEAPPETTAEPTTEVPTTEAPPKTTAEPTAEVPTTEAPTEPSTAEAPTEPAPTQPAPTEAPTEPAPTQPSKPEKGKNGNTILYVLLGAVAVTAGVLGGVLIGGRNKKAPAADKQEPEKKAEETKAEAKPQAKNNSGQQKNNPGQQKNNSGQQKNSSGQQKNNAGQQKNNSGQQKNNAGQQKNNSGQQKNNSGQQKKKKK